MTIDDLAASPVGVHMLDDLVGLGFATRPLTDLSEAQLYKIVVDAALQVSAGRWTDSPTRSFPWEQRVAPEVAERLARAVPACAAARWWSASVVDRPQVWLGAVADAPVAGPPRAHIEGAPPTELWTSSAVAGMPNAWWPVVESGAAYQGEAVSIWQVNLRAGARVFEIRTPDDWRWLCESFPGPDVGRDVVPRWAAVGEQFDGIHLTVEGLICTQGVAIGTDRGPALLESWDAESTSWLRWSFTSVERLGSVRDPSHSTTERVRRGRASPRARRRS